MAGRRPLPTAAKVLKGTFRRDRANPREPQPPTGRMCEPDWLKGQGLWMWRQLAQLLGPKEMRVLSRADRHALMLLCDSYREYREARATVEKEGQILDVENKYGSVKVVHPAVKIASDAWRRVRLMLVEFGLTPSARAKVNTEDEVPKDELEELLKRRDAR